MKVSWLLIVFHLATFQYATGQQTPAYMKLGESSYYQWTGENGLISNNITSAIQAQSGFIWITTYNGIMRFDGIKVDVFDRGSISFLATDAFYKVYQDKQGMLWFASQGSGIVRYNGDQFSLLTLKNGEVPKSARCLLLEDSVVWIGSNNQGLFKVVDNKITSVYDSMLNKLTILCLARDRGNNLWIGTDGFGLYRINGSRVTQFTEKNGLMSNTINALNVSGKKIFVGTNEGLNQITGDEVKSIQELEHFHITDVAVDSSDNVWVAADNGLARIAENRPVEFEGEENGLPFNRINSIAFDSEGSVWLGTGRNGLIQIKQPNFVNYTTFQGLSHNRCNIIYEGKANEFYIGSDAGQIDVFKNGEIKPLKIKTELNEAGIRDICLDDEGALWAAYYKGALRIENGTERLFTDKDGLPANDLRRILKSDDGSLWFASRSGGIINYKNNRFGKLYDKDHGLESNYVLSLEQDENGTLYVGTHSGGLTLIKKDGTAKTYHLTTNDAGILIFNLLIESDHEIFVVANIGLYFFDGKNFKLIETNRNFKGETHFDWVKDQQGNSWISSNLGLLRISATDLQAYLEGKLKRVSVTIYDNQEGMKNKECTGATRMLTSTTGKIWVPTIGGVSVLYPENIKVNRIAPKVYITSLILDQDTLTNTNAIIQPGNLRYTFTYTGISFGSPSKVMFRHRLLGIRDEWTNASSNRTIEYTNLPPGSYTFQVIAANNDNIWNNTGASFTFYVNPFFYQTTLFYIIIITVFLLIVYGIYKWRLRTVETSNQELRKLNEELDNFVYSTSHDLRAPLTSIMGLINLFRLEKHNADEYIQMIEKSILKMDEFIKEITDFSRNARLEVEPVPIDFKKIIEDTLEHLRFLDVNNKIEKTVTIKVSEPFHSDKLRITIIFNNLLTNAIKYINHNHEHPRIDIEVDQKDSRAIISVKDNGIGIKPEQHEQIFNMFYRGSEQSQGSGLGLYIVKETVHKLKGHIKVHSEFGKGSLFEVRIPNLKKD